MTATPVVRSLPDGASVVEVHGSKFLLEWLDRDVLASAALHLRAGSHVPAGSPTGLPRADAA